MIHTLKGFGIVNKAEVDVFLELSCFFYDPVDVGNLISGSSAFSTTSLNIWKSQFIRIKLIRDVYGGSDGKDPACNAGDIRDVSSIPRWERSPGDGNGNPLQYSCMENSHGQRSLAGYNSQGQREL